ncbi:MAG: DUF2277 domain-containing protein [Spirochaetota bacterium]
MCRNIKLLYNFEPPASEEEIQASALQFVRKVSGFQKPSKQNEAAFNTAVEEIAYATQKLFASLQTTTEVKNREVEAEKRRRKNLQRFAPKS